MKKLFEKLNKNKIAFSLFIIICFLILEFIISGFYGVIPGWNGIVHFLYEVNDSTYAGSSIYSELIVCVLMIPILLIFGNAYIFSRKPIPLKERIKFYLPFLIELIILIVFRFIASGGMQVFNKKEFFAMIILYGLVGIFEELLCRGWLLTEFLERFGKNRKGILFSLFVSSLIFGLMHITNIITVGQDVAVTFVQIIMAVFMGFGLGATYIKTKNIWTPIFLHGFYDLAISMLDINKTISCYTEVEQLPWIVTIISGVIVNLLITAPLWLCSLKLLNKTAINEIADEKEELSESQIKKDKESNKTITISQYIIIGLVVLIHLGAALNVKLDKCVLYNKKIVPNNYVITSSNLKDYTLTNVIKIPDLKCDDSGCQNITKEITNSIRFSITDDGLQIAKDNGSSLFKQNKLVRMAIFKIKDGYGISLLKRTNDGTKVFYSNYLTNSVLNNNININTLVDSFKELELPIINEIGTINYDNETYPLFKTIYQDYYIIDDDGNIKKIGTN